MQRKWLRRTLIGLLSAVCITTLLIASILALSLIQQGNVAPTVRANNNVPLPLFAANSLIAHENQLPGTKDWQLDAHTSLSYITGYAGVASATPGMAVPLYISALHPVTFSLNVYRLGWYQGLGGRLYYQSPQLSSLAQGLWTTWAGLQDCPTCTLDPTTHLLETHWQSEFALPIGRDWLSGVYLIKIITTNHAEAYIPLVVRNPKASSAVLANISVNTYQAYNLWGGFSLYRSDKIETAKGFLTGAQKVSFNRPYDRSAGAGDLLAWDIHLIRWMERSDLDVTYTTDVDITEQPQQLLQHRVVITMAHDEYWTKAMRDGMEAARDKGVSLGFFGANAAYWQSRYEPDDLGNADRVIVCYKVLSKTPTTLKRDPMYGKDNAVVTTEWRDPVVHRPESELLGLQYLSLIPTNATPDWVVTNAIDPLEVSAGLKPLQHIPGGLLGYEYDSLGATRSTPKNLHILASSPVKNTYNVQQVAMSAYYYAPSGAFVFDAGSMWWADGLDSGTPPFAYQKNFLSGNAAIMALTYNLVEAMLTATPAAPLVISSDTPHLTNRPNDTSCYWLCLSDASSDRDA